MDALEDEVVKILLIGDAMVGKTSFIDRYVNDDFTDDYKCTIGCDFTCKTVLRPGSWRSYLKLQFWDIAGQERFPLLTRAYYRYVRGCIVMFDITSPESFQGAKKWKKNLDINTQKDKGETVPCLLVANKADLSDHAVTYKEMDDLCQDFGFSQWTMTSVKDGSMIEETVNYLLDVILKRSSQTFKISEYDLVDNDVIQLNTEERCTCRGKKFIVQKLDRMIPCCTLYG